MTTRFLSALILVFGWQAFSQVEGSYIINESNKEGLGCFGEYILDAKTTGTLELEVGPFVENKADRTLELNFTRDGGFYKVSCEVLYVGEITRDADGNFFGDLSWENEGGHCKCKPGFGAEENCRRRVDPFLKEAPGTRLKVEHNTSGISYQQDKPFPGTGATPCGNEYPNLQFGRL
ncbi:MAG: hypothetical protein AAF202_05880 [Pseudomonadota bacterium]